MLTLCVTFFTEEPVTALKSQKSPMVHHPVLPDHHKDPKRRFLGAQSR